MLYRSARALGSMSARWQMGGLRVVLTHGVFDLLHRGHLLYLTKASAQGDRLVVGVDSDELTRIRKGPRRPIEPWNIRVANVSQVPGVTCVYLKTHLTRTIDYVRIIKPDMLVISEGHAFSARELSDASSWGIGIQFIPRDPTISTTDLIEDINRPDDRV